MVPATALNVADVAPAATLTEAGVVSNELLTETATLTPPAGAGSRMVTVQVLVVPDVRLVGLHCTDATVTGATTFNIAVCVAPE